MEDHRETRVRNLATSQSAAKTGSGRTTRLFAEEDNVQECPSDHAGVADCIHCQSW
jgi:hypothetical protein